MTVGFNPKISNNRSRVQQQNFGKISEAKVSKMFDEVGFSDITEKRLKEIAEIVKKELKDATNTPGAKMELESLAKHLDIKS